MKHFFSKYTILFVFFILLLSIFFRFFQLSQYPPILNRDEAALAYNAKLILQSGKDEWGKILPLQFKSFGDYKLPGYVYTLVPLFSLFGANDFIVRLPSALAGLGIVIVGSLLTRELFNLREKKYIKIIALVVFSFTPVFFFYSRMAWEANVALLFFLSAITVFLRNKEGVLISDLLSGVLLLFATMTYNTPLLLLPFLLPVLVVYRGLKNVRKWIFPLSIWTIVLLSGMFNLLAVAEQKSGITIFTDETITLLYPAFRQQFPAVFQSIFGNKYMYWLDIMIRNYFATFSPRFLVSHGGSHPWHSILGRGHIYWIEYIGFIFGVITLVYKSMKIGMQKKWKEVVLTIIPLYMLLISPIPAVTTVDAPHATRSLFTFFLIIGFSIYGGRKFISLQVIRSYRKILIFALTIIFIIESSIYYSQYFFEWNKNYPKQLNVGFDSIIQQVERTYPNDKKVVIDDEGYIYVMTAWYANMDSNEFFSTIKKHLPDKIGLQYGYKVGNYRFVKSIDDRMEEEKVMLFNQDGKWIIKKVE